MRIGLCKQMAAAGVVLAWLGLLAWLDPTPAFAGGYMGHYGGGGGGAGVGVGVGVGSLLLNQAIHRHEQNQETRDSHPGCQPPMVPSRHGCALPNKGKEYSPPKSPEITACAPPMTYSHRAHGCVGPKPAVPQLAKCEAPMVYSRHAHGCIAPQGGNEPEHAKCDPSHDPRCARPYPPSQQASCQWPFVPAGHGCACAPGLTAYGDSCGKPPVVVVSPAPPSPPSLAPLPPSPPIPPGPPPQIAAPVPSSSPQSPIPVAQNGPAGDRCMPQDLLDLLQATYGPRPGLRACPTACLPKPASFTQAKLDEAAKSSGINWCENCVQVGSYLPLDAIQKLEQLAHVNLCVNPDLCRLGTPRPDHITEIRTVFKDLPGGVKNEGNLAVVVGNQNYQGGLPANANGKTDADAVMALLTDQLGYKQENIIDLRDATFADFARVFGSESDPGGEIAKHIDKQNPGDVFIYVASHGMVKEEDPKQAYLLPVDAKLDDLDHTAYALQQLYNNLGKTGARTTMLLLETNFAKSLDELIDPPNLPELDVDAMPDTPVAGLAVFTASDRDQKTIQDPEYGIGLFTRYMIEGLAGRADEAPLGNGDKRIDTVELYVYTADAVRNAARKSFGLEQKPILSKIDNLVVGRLAEK